MTPKRTRAMELLTAVTSWSSSQDSEPARLSASQDLRSLCSFSRLKPNGSEKHITSPD